MLERPNLNISFLLTIIEKLHKINRNSAAVVIIYQEKLFKKGKRSFFPLLFSQISHMFNFKFQPDKL